MSSLMTRLAPVGCNITSQGEESLKNMVITGSLSLNFDKYVVHEHDTYEKY